jgi:hypothetical protein
MAETIHLPQHQVQATAKIKELRARIREHKAELYRLEQEASQLEYQRSISAPHGIYRHRRGDGSEIEADATILETDGDAIYIEYHIPRSLAQRGEEDGYLLWLRSPEELRRLTPRT